MLDLTECHLAAHKILLNELNKFRFINIYIVLQEHINPSPAIGLGCLFNLLETSINIKDQSLYFFFSFLNNNFSFLVTLHPSCTEKKYTSLTVTEWLVNFTNAYLFHISPINTSRKCFISAKKYPRKLG